jgi:hypothetical protein
MRLMQVLRTFLYCNSFVQNVCADACVRTQVFLMSKSSLYTSTLCVLSLSLSLVHNQRATFPTQFASPFRLHLELVSMRTHHASVELFPHVCMDRYTNSLKRLHRRVSGDRANYTLKRSIYKDPTSMPSMAPQMTCSGLWPKTSLSFVSLIGEP